MDSQAYPAQPPEQIELSVLSDAEELARRKSDWDRLAATDRRDGMFRGYAWNVLWLKHMAPRVTPHVLEITRASGEVVGIVPLCERTHKDSVFRFRSLGFTGREVTCGDFLDVLAEPGYKDRVLSCVLEYLGQALRRYELILISEFLQGSDTAHKLSEWVNEKKLRARWQEERAAPYIELPSSFDQYRRTLSRNTRSNLRRRGRQLLEEQGYTIERLRGPETVLPQLPHLFRLHEARWRSLGQKGVFVHPGFREFLRAFIEESHPQTETVLYMMCADDEPMAAILLFRWGETTMYYQSGWDPASPGARFSPNLVLFGRAIADAIDEGYRYFEFLRGDESFKGKFTTTARPTTTLLVTRDGIKPRLYLTAMGIKDRAKSVIANRLPAVWSNRQSLFQGGSVAEEHCPDRSVKAGRIEKPIHRFSGTSGRSVANEKRIQPMPFPRHVFQKVRQKFRYGLMTKVALDRLAMMGIQITPFYLVEERLSEEVAMDFEKGFEAYEVVPLGPEEMEAVARIPKYGFTREQLLDRLQRGNQCLGVKQDGALAAFTWADLSECSSEWWRFPLKGNEAYLFDAYTLEEFRGKGVAPYMRYACYRALNQMGRDRFYSISEVFNAPSLRFKERLKAKLLSLWVSVELFRRYRWTWELKDCKGREIATKASKRNPVSNRPSPKS